MMPSGQRSSIPKTYKCGSLYPPCEDICGTRGSTGLETLLLWLPSRGDSSFSNTSWEQHFFFCQIRQKEKGQIKTGWCEGQNETGSELGAGGVNSSQSLGAESDGGGRCLWNLGTLRALRRCWWGAAGGAVHSDRDGSGRDGARGRGGGLGRAPAIGGGVFNPCRRGSILAEVHLEDVLLQVADPVLLHRQWAVELHLTEPDRAHTHTHTYKRPKTTLMSCRLLFYDMVFRENIK